MSENVLVIGATSGIGRALCHRLAGRGCALVLAGRDTEELTRIAGDLRIRYQTAAFVESFEATDWQRHGEFFERCVERFDGALDGVVLCHGYLPRQEVAQVDGSEARQTVEVNYLSAMSVLNHAANYLERRRTGYIAAVSSVAGDRGRQSNYTYGSAKAALTTYLEGLRNRLFHAGVHVLTIKPGFVDTPMTHGLVAPDSPLVAKPERVARDIDRAISKRRNVIYTPWFWRPIMLVIRAIPQCVFKRLKL